MFILLWKMRQDIEFQKTRATLQGLLGQKGSESKHIMEAFEDLKNAYFPFERNQKTAEETKLKEVMMREIARGPLSVTPMVDNLDEHKVRAKLARGAERLHKRAQQLRQDMDSKGPDPFEAAKTRRRR